MTKTRKKGTALLPRPVSERPKLSERQLDVLDTLAVYGDWARPMDVGARDGSHHSATLGSLAARGLAERKKYHSISCYHGSTQRQKLVNHRWVYTDGHPPYEGCCCKGSCRYKITPAGRKELSREEVDE